MRLGAKLDQFWRLAKDKAATPPRFRAIAGAMTVAIFSSEYGPPLSKRKVLMPNDTSNVTKGNASKRRSTVA